MPVPATVRLYEYLDAREYAEQYELVGMPPGARGTDATSMHTSTASA
eukprot:SAG31_NODE_5992_length_2222_cov_80.651437_2_plen_47_part_00